jgi:hypothetical protein
MKKKSLFNRRMGTDKQQLYDKESIPTDEQKLSHFQLGVQ